MGEGETRSTVQYSKTFPIALWTEKDKKMSVKTSLPVGSRSDFTSFPSVLQQQFFRRMRKLVLFWDEIMRTRLGLEAVQQIVQQAHDYLRQPVLDPVLRWQTLAGPKEDRFDVIRLEHFRSAELTVENRLEDLVAFSLEVAQVVKERFLCHRERDPPLHVFVSLGRAFGHEMEAFLGDSPDERDRGPLTLSVDEPPGFYGPPFTFDSRDQIHCPTEVVPTRASPADVPYGSRVLATGGHLWRGDAALTCATTHQRLRAPIMPMLSHRRHNNILDFFLFFVRRWFRVWIISVVLHYGLKKMFDTSRESWCRGRVWHHANLQVHTGWQFDSNMIHLGCIICL